MASALASQLRRFDRDRARRATRELLLVLPGADGPRGEIVARRVLDRLRTIKVEADGERRPLRISVGLAAWQDDISGEDLLERARAAARRGNGGEGAADPGQLLAARAWPAARICIITAVLSGSELWLLRLMADRGLALLDADSLLIVIEERGELRVAASAGPRRCACGSCPSRAARWASSTAPASRRRSTARAARRRRGCTNWASRCARRWSSR